MVAHSTIPEVGRLRQEGNEFKASLGYTTKLKTKEKLGIVVQTYNPRTWEMETRGKRVQSLTQYVSGQGQSGLHDSLSLNEKWQEASADCWWTVLSDCSLNRSNDTCFQGDSDEQPGLQSSH